MRDEGESKDPESVCSSILIQGVLPRDCPPERLDPEVVVEAVAHAESLPHAVRGEHLVSGMPEDAPPGSFDAPSVATLLRACSRCQGWGVAAKQTHPQPKIA